MCRVAETGALTYSDVNDSFETDFWNEKGWLIDTAEFSGKKGKYGDGFGWDCF